MIMGGLQKTTLVDYPGKVACTVFTVGCNFRCPFCHNKDLINIRMFENSKLQKIEEKDFFEFLKKRQGLLDGVCITGGEPLLQKDIISFIKKIKRLGFLVKLDTNGSFPKKLKELVDKNLLDFIAMDIKTTFKEYKKVVNFQFSIFNLQESIKLILNSGIQHQFRTTVVPGLHDEKIIKQMSKELKKMGVKKLKLQNFRPENCLDLDYLKKIPFSEKEFNKLQSLW